MPLEPYLDAHRWLILPIWVVLHTADYRLGHAVVRLVSAQSVFTVDERPAAAPGPQEPESGQRFPTRLYWGYLAGGSAILGFFALPPVPSLWFVLVSGALVVGKLAVCMLRIANVHQYSGLIHPEGKARGTVAITVSWSFRLVYMEMLLIAIYTAVMAAVCGSAFLASGALRLFLLALTHREHAERARRSVTRTEIAAEEAAPRT